jgi:Na+-transporting NADH:ubiquinone oxidoreductase subunit A
MSKDIKIKKGLNIRLKGEASKTLSKAPKSRTFVIRPSDFHLITPKMVVKEGEKIQAGDIIFYSKTKEEIKFVSPVSGTLTKIERGARRVIKELVIEADQQDSYKDFGIVDPNSMNQDEIKNHLLNSGCWPFIKQRPMIL